MAFLYPWGNTQQLNLDWILQKIKELETGGGGADLDEISEALLAASYAQQAYEQFDIVFRDGKLYLANADIPAPGEAWTPEHWDEILLGGPVSALMKHVSNLDSDNVINDSQVTGDTVSDALDTLKDAIDNIPLDSDSISNESQVTGDTVSDALDNLSTAISDEVTARQNAISTLTTEEIGTISKSSTITTGTIDSQLIRKVGNVVNIGGRIYGMTDQVANDTFFTISENCRPNAQRKIMCVLTKTDNSIAVYYANVNANGNIGIGLSNSIQITQILIIGTYPI